MNVLIITGGMLVLAPIIIALDFGIQEVLTQIAGLLIMSIINN